MYWKGAERKRQQTGIPLPFVRSAVMNAGRTGIADGLIHPSWH